MSSNGDTPNSNQLAFQELFVGTLIYAVVLGFFNDYTNIVDAKSFSTIFLASIILEVLTFLTFKIKELSTNKFKDKSEFKYKIARFFNVWLIMFLSKFVFVWVIDLIFTNNININGFFGILLVVATVTILHRLAYYTYKLLGDK
jgi:hypothetical protein